MACHMSPLLYHNRKENTSEAIGGKENEIQNHIHSAKKIEVLNPYMLPFRGLVFPRQGFLSAYAGKAGFFSVF